MLANLNLLIFIILIYLYFYFIAAVRLNKNAQNCTDVEIINIIKAWLVRSKDRFNNNNNKNKEIVNEDTEPLNNKENPAVQDTQDKDNADI